MLCSFIIRVCPAVTRRWDNPALLTYLPTEWGLWLTNTRRTRRPNQRPRRRRTRRLRRGHLPRRLPPSRPHRRRRNAPYHGNPPLARRPPNRHLRLLPLRHRPGPPLHLLHARHPQRAQPRQRSRARPALRHLVLLPRRHGRRGEQRHGLPQESYEW